MSSDSRLGLTETYHGDFRKVGGARLDERAILSR